MTPPAADRLTRFGIWLIAIALTIGSARAGLINVDFNDATANAGSPTATFAGAAAIGQAGDQWNGLNLTDGWGDTNITKVYSGLIDSFGGSSGATLTLTGSRLAYVNVDSGLSFSRPFDALLLDLLTNKPVFTFSGLTPGSYDVYVYSGDVDNDGKGDASGSVQVNSGTKQFFTATLAGNALVAGRDYLKFSSVTVTDGTLKINGVDFGDGYALRIAGFQIKLALPLVTWASTGTTDWGTAGNWTSEYGAITPPNAVGSNVVFKASAALSSVDLGSADRSVGSLAFNNVEGASVTLASTQGKVVIFDNGSALPVLTVSGSHAISAGVKLNGDLSVKPNGITDTLTLSGPISNAGATARGLTLAGNGTLVLAGSNSYTGLTKVTSGTLSLSATGALPGWNINGRYSVASGAGIAVGNGMSDADVASIRATSNFTSGAYLGFDTSAGERSSPAIGGTPGLVKVGANKLTLTGANSYSGDTKIAAGTLEIGGSGSLGGGSYSGAIAINSGAALNFTTSADQILGGVISGGGGLAWNGGGTLTLNANSAYSAGLTVNGGILKATSADAFQGTLQINPGAKAVFTNGWASSIGRTVVINGGIFDSLKISQSADFSVAAVTMQGGLWAQTGAAYFDIYNNGVTGALPITTLASSSEATIAANLHTQVTANFSGDLVFTVAQGSTVSGVDLVISGLLDPRGGSGNITKAGPGLMAITSTNNLPTGGNFGTYAGTTTVTGGTLQLGTGGAFGAIDSSSGVSVAAGATLAFKRSDNPTFNLKVSGAGNLSQLGTGTVYLANITSDYTGVTTLNGGVLNVTTLANVNTASPIGKGSASGAAADLVLNGGTLQHTAASASTNRLFTIGANGATLDASSTFMRLGSGGGAIAFASSNTPASLTLQGSGTGILAASLGNSGSGSNQTALTKAGAGSWTLAAANAYTGTTTLSGGKLYLNGGNATSAITVASGATLGGSGSASSAIATVADGGSVEGGAGGAGTLTLGGLTFSGGGAVQVSNLGNYTSVPTIHATNLTTNGGANSVVIAVNGSLPAGVGTTHVLEYAGEISGTGFAAFALDAASLPARTSLTLVNRSGVVDVDYTADYTVWSGGTWAPNAGATWKLASNASATAYGPNDAVVFDDTASSTAVMIDVANVTPHSATFNHSLKNFTLGGAFGIAGGASLTKSGTGMLTINNANSYSGTSFVNGGILQANNANALGSGNLSFGGGTLQFTAASAGQDWAARIKNSPAAITLDTNNLAVTYAGNLDSSNRSGLTKVGLGTLTLAGTNTYVGITTVAGGTLQFAKKAALYNSAASDWTPSNITVNSGATLMLNVGGANELSTSDFATLMDGVHLGGSTASSGLLSGSFIGIDTSNASGGNVDYTPVIANPANGNAVGLIKNGSGTLNIGGKVNTYTGGTIVNGGTLALGDATNAVIRRALTINSGGKVTFGSTLGYTGTADTRLSVINLYGGTLDRTSSGNATTGGLTFNLRGGTLAHSGNGNHQLWNGNGGVVINVEESPDASVISGGLQLDITQLFTVANGAAAVDLLVSGKLVGSYGITKAGPGTLNLTAANLHTGATTVSAGTLLVNNTSGSGTGTAAVSVASGATLGGSGSISGAVNVSGVLAPATAAKTLTCGPLALLTGSTLRCEMDSSVSPGGTAALLKILNFGVPGNVTLTGTVALTLADVAASKKAFPVGTTFSLIHYTGTWNGGFLTLGGRLLTNGLEFTTGLNNWRIDYAVTNPGRNFPGDPVAGTDKFINLTAIPFVGSATLGNLQATAITAHTATLGGTVTASGIDAPSITFYYGPSDGFTTPERWLYSITLPGNYSGPFAMNISGLSPLSTYRFTACATNSAGNSWVVPAVVFSTTAIPPVVATIAATAVAGTTATVGANVTDNGGENPTVTLFYGPSNGGTNAGAWAKSLNLGSGVGAMSVALTGLASATDFYFRAFAQNSGGGVWGPATLSFSTLPISAPLVENRSADGITGTTAVLHGRVTQVGNDPPAVTLFYGTSDGGTNPGAWSTAIALGNQTTDFTRFLSGLSINTAYFFRWRAVNAAGSAWSAETASFTTTSQVPSTIVINEIHFNGVDNTVLNEFIEIFNAGTSSVVMTNWRLSGGIDYTFPAGTTIAPNGFLIVAATPATILAKYGKVALGPWEGSLSSDGEFVRLRDATNTTIDEVDYKVGFPWPVAAGGDGASLERINPLLDGSLGGSWRSSTIPADNATTDTVSPGAVNLQFVANAPPAIRQVQHLPQQPTSVDPIVISAKVSDLQGVASVTLSYQVVTPGNYIPRYLSNVPSGNTIAKEVRTLNPAFELAANWTTVPMADTGTNGDVEYGDGIYTVVLPAQSHRTLLRYRITVTDTLGASVRVPYADDPAANFACFIYNGVPAYGATTAATLQTLPVYQLITKSSDWLDCVAYDGNKQLTWDASRFYYNWNGTFVYDGVVYDNIAYRTRGANGRYQGSGKRSMRFKFNRGSYITLRDQRGKLYPQKTQTITTCKGVENSGSMTYSLNEWMNMRMWNAFGLPAPLAHFAHWRNVTTAAEQADNYHGDFQGLIMVQEDYDSRFLDSHHMQKGNLYKLLNETDNSLDQQRYQAPLGAKNGADHAWVGNINNSMQPAALTANVNLDKWDRYHAICEAVQHYDYWPNCDKNMVYYFEPVYTAENGYRGKLWILPYDHDASWGPSWNSGVDNVYDALLNGGANAALRPDYYGTVRECRTLLFQPDQINPLLDEIASYIIPFQKADDTRWKNAPSDVGNYSGWGGPGSTSIADLVVAMKNFANGRGSFMDQLGNTGGESSLYPARPTISFIGTPGYPVNDLRFQTTAFSDPQGVATFSALQWRIAEVNASATYTPGVKRLLEYEARHVSAELTTFGNTYTFPTASCEAGKRYRARVRHKDTTGRWSNWSTPVEFAAIAAPIQTLVHYWNFNVATSPLIANWTFGGAALSVAGDYLSDTGENFAAANARNGDGDGAHLRVNSPLTAGTMASFVLPTTSFENIIIKYETRRSGQGAGIQNVAYTLDGITYTPFATFTILNDNPVVQTLDFRALSQVNNNPRFGLRITFAKGLGGTSGNDRFDNFTVDGDRLAGQFLPKLLPGNDADWNTTTNWANSAVPNSTAALAIVGAPAATNRAVTLNAPVTLGTLEMDNADSAFRNQITSALGISLTFNGGSVPALLDVAGTGIAYIEFNLAGDVNLATDLRLNVSNIVGEHLVTGDVGNGALRLRGTWTGSGGLIKQGLGVATLSGLGKTFTGPILIEQGVLSITQPAAPGQTSAITVLNGGQIRLISGNDELGPRIYTFGCPLVLAGTGRNNGIALSEHEGVLGAMRYDPDIGGTNRAIVTNPVTLTAATDIHIDGPDNTLEFAGPLGGTGNLTKSGGGTLALSGATHTHSGDTIVDNGILSITNPNLAPTATVTIGLAAGSGSVLNLPSAGTSHVAALVIDGVTMPNKTYDSANSFGAITGFGKIQVGPVGAVATLSGLTLSSGSLSPAFATATNSYTASVPNATTSVTVTPVVTDSSATVTVNGTTAVTGAASAAIPLLVGTNAITVQVTAQDGFTQAAYTVTVTRISNVATLSGLTLSSGTLSAEFAAATLIYTTSVANATTGLIVTPVVTDSSATVKVNGTIVTSGTASASIQLEVGANPISVLVTAQDGTTQATYTVIVTRISNVATLAGLGLSAGSLSPAFSSETWVYAASVPNATTGVSVMPTLTDMTATVRVNGTLVASGMASAAIQLVVGSNPIIVSVTAQDGTTTSDYTIAVTRVSSAIATLSGLTLSSGSLSPEFAAGTLVYTASVPNATTGMTVTPVVTDSSATVKVNGTIVTSGTASASIPLGVGANPISVLVTAQDGTTQATYTVTVTRISNVATLAGLELSAGSLSPAFAAETMTYTASVPNATTGVTVTPVATDSSATVKVNGTIVTSGTASASIPLGVGANPISVLVTA
ncbi:MAG: cadherin-like beta sandwich domain-containing protein, partial [Verrucomicrobiota bacterium]